MKVHRQKTDQICKSGLSINTSEPSEVQSRVDSLQSNWNSLNSLSQLRTKQLQDAAEAYQVICYLLILKILYLYYHVLYIFSFMLMQMKQNLGYMSI